MAEKRALTTSSGDYILELNLDAIDKADTMGVNLSLFGEKVVSNTRKLFYLALLKNHKSMTPNKAYAILDEAIADGLALNEIANALLELVMSVTSPNVPEGKTAKATLTAM